MFSVKVEVSSVNELFSCCSANTINDMYFLIRKCCIVIIYLIYIVYFILTKHESQLIKYESQSKVHEGCLDHRKENRSFKQQSNTEWCMM